MYRQIQVHPDDCVFQRILWIDQHQEVITYQLSTVTYGLASAPFLALRTIAQLIEDEGAKFPLAKLSLVKGRYVDDIFGGADSIQQTQKIISQVILLCKAGSFPLQKWTNNNRSILDVILQKNYDCLTPIRFDENTTVHILGLCWNSQTDSLQFSSTFIPPKAITKRYILSSIAKILDPLGLLVSNSTKYLSLCGPILPLYIRGSTTTPLVGRISSTIGCFIHEGLPQAIWKFILDKENSSDCGTRGLTPAQLSQHIIWWSGPHWLSKDSSTWPKDPTSINALKNLKERSAQILTSNYKVNDLWELIHRYSNITRLLRITALCRRAVARFKRTTTSLTTFISTQKLEEARLYWIRIIQFHSFHQEIKTLSKMQLLLKSSSLLRLTPFLDSQGLLKVGGRLQQAPLSLAVKHPLILPQESPLTSLIISDAHKQTFHGGTQSTMSFIQNNYWIVGGRAPVRSYILKCMKCSRYRQRRAQQIMGQLPPQRVTPSRPFLNSGVDYTGPFTLKNWKGRNSRTYKGYIALFVCLSTSAVHIELVTDYTTDTFIAAYKRFVSRREICSTLTSDCGTNLKGADVELRKLFLSSSKELDKLSSLLAQDGTQWNFIPPASPHFGGKWEAGVKSVKYHLRQVVENQVLTYEEMTTMLTQIEAILNSRPLCALTDEPDDLNVLTPAHFLIGSSLSTIPEPFLETENTSRLSRWQLTRQMIESFWTHWNKEYLPYLSIYKWNRTSPPLQEGTLVLVVDERYPPSKWPLGHIIKTHSRKDGHVRVVTVRTQASTFQRPIVKLCPLPNSN